MSDLEQEYDSDQSVSKSHSKLLQAVAQLDKGQRVKKPERTEPTLEVSEYHLVKSGISDKDVVFLDNLVKSLGSKGEHTKIKKRLTTTHKKANVLPKPLEKPVADRLKRAAGFQRTTEEVKKWVGVITQNRTASKLVLPLNKPSFKAETTDQFVKRFTLKSDLEKELAALEPDSAIQEEKEDKFKMTLKEMKERRQEIARFRALQSYKAAEAHRQKRIKSKKFHRVQKKERIKQQLKEFEELQKTDPKAALEKLQLLDKTRAEERMSLRHKSTGQWAKSKQVRAKYDKETRQVLAEQLSIGRELTQKINAAKADSEDEEEENNTQSTQLPISATKNSSDKDNPWVNTVKTEAEINEFIQSYRKYWDRQNQKNKEENSASNYTISTNVKSKTMNQENNTENEQKISMEVEQEASEKTEQKKDDANDSLIKEINVRHHKVIKRKELNAEKKIKNNIEEEGTAYNSLSEQNVKKKKMRLSKKIVATSAWEVQLLNDAQVNALSATDKVSEMFDTMEDKLQTQINSKLECIKENLQLDQKKKIEKEKKKKKNDKNNVKKKRSKEYPGELRPRNQHQKPEFDDYMEETTGEVASSREENSMDLKSLTSNVESSTSETKKTDNTEIDPNKYMNVKPKHLKSYVPDVIGGDDVLDDSENEEEKHNIISEAFADDDIVEQFKKEKEEEIKKSQPEDIDLTLPGWGSWGGENIKPSSRKRKQFILKVPKEALRRDENKGNVIIFEEGNAKVKQHQVDELPFPFSTVKDFEASIRAPIGRDFLPENAHKKLIERPVKTAKGQVIEPMDDDVLIKTKNVESMKKKSKPTRPTGKVDPAKRKPVRRIKSKKST